MNKKAVTPVAAFQLSGGVFRTGNNDTNANHVVSCIHGGMKESVTISSLSGLNTGY
jgi:hypothetical protein